MTAHTILQAEPVRGCPALPALSTLTCWKKPTMFLLPALSHGEHMGLTTQLCPQAQTLTTDRHSGIHSPHGPKQNVTARSCGQRCQETLSCLCQQVAPALGHQTRCNWWPNGQVQMSHKATAWRLASKKTMYLSTATWTGTAKEAGSELLGWASEKGKSSNETRH